MRADQKAKPAASGPQSANKQGFKATPLSTSSQNKQRPPVKSSLRGTSEARGM